MKKKTSIVVADPKPVIDRLSNPDGIAFLRDRFSQPVIDALGRTLTAPVYCEDNYFAVIANRLSFLDLMLSDFARRFVVEPQPRRSAAQALVGAGMLIGELFRPSYVSQDPYPVDEVVTDLFGKLEDLEPEDIVVISRHLERWHQESLRLTEGVFTDITLRALMRRTKEKSMVRFVVDAPVQALAVEERLTCFFAGLAISGWIFPPPADNDALADFLSPKLGETKQDSVDVKPPEGK